MGEHFPFLGAVRGVRRPVGAERNSRNHVVETSKARILLKRLPGSVDADRLEAQLRIAGRLRSTGLPIPAVIPTVGGKNHLRRAVGVWYALEHVEGQHWSGTREQTDDLLNLVPRLLEALAQEAVDVALGPPVPLPSPQDLAILGQFDRQEASWDEFLGEPAAGVLRDARVRIQTDLEEVVDLPDFPVGVTHIDLHPHNLLVRRGRIAAVLDLESLLPAVTASMVCFGGYKLLRQAVVAQQLGPGGAELAGDRLRDALVASEHVPEAAAVRAGALARAEILRRVLYILRAALEGDRTWVDVLAIHAAGLVETRVLFPAKS